MEKRYIPFKTYDKLKTIRNQLKNQERINLFSESFTSKDLITTRNCICLEICFTEGRVFETKPSTKGN